MSLASLQLVRWDNPYYAPAVTLDIRYETVEWLLATLEKAPRCPEGQTAVEVENFTAGLYAALTHRPEADPNADLL